MVFDSRSYSVLVVSSAEKFFDAIRPLLPENYFYPVTNVTSIAAAKRAVLEKTYDFVIINTPLRDDFGTRFAIDVSEDKNTVCLLLVKSELHEEIRLKVLEHGVFTLSKPTSSAAMTLGLEWMMTVRERLRKVERKSTSIEDKMQEIRLVNRAKWLLIENLQLSEQDAHRYVEKQSMDRCVSKREIAMEIINTYHA